ncbi:hypothetical protein E0Z10_g9289 [Xylaria hypoxylon]|uniref:F-box domain-containing protein n=1 Tax=Xylaria hypoxylon TaxID=37992 RepID=A0A4Z0Y956_9PEZI|nr:hypothetical protein E0Z10_g9289 [Xylaria hypoxylon]
MSATRTPPSFTNLPKEVIVRIFRKTEDTADLLSIMSTCKAFYSIVQESRSKDNRDILRETALRSFGKMPLNLRRQVLVAHKLNILAFSTPTQRMSQEQESVWKILYCWYNRVLCSPGVYRGVLWLADISFWYPTIVPFVEDYCIKSALCQGGVMRYDTAPSWAHSSLPRCLPISSEATSWSRAPGPEMEKAFFRLQTFCEMYNALERQDVQQFLRYDRRSGDEWLGECHQQTVLHDFSRTLYPDQLDEFRSVLWYVSTLWAILLDEIAVEEYPGYSLESDRAVVLLHLCAAGFPKLRRALWAPKELRRVIVLKRLEQTPRPSLSDATILWLHDRTAFAPMCDPLPHGIPIVHRIIDNPIPFKSQLQLRGEAWVFRKWMQVQRRHTLGRFYMCCGVDLFLPTCLEWDVDPTRWLNLSPVCYGGIHKDFSQY